MGRIGMMILNLVEDSFTHDGSIGSSPHSYFTNCQPRVVPLKRLHTRPMHSIQTPKLNVDCLVGKHRDTKIHKQRARYYIHGDFGSNLSDTVI